MRSIEEKLNRSLEKWDDDAVLSDISAALMSLSGFLNERNGERRFGYGATQSHIRGMRMVISALHFAADTLVDLEENAE